MKKFRIFIASPGDVRDERNIVSLIIEELRRTLGNALNIELEAVRWETHVWPDTGDDAQDVVNNEIGEYDVLVGIMWKHFGTPTGRADSGTQEEFKRAYDYFRRYGRPKIMFYFKTMPFYFRDISSIRQFTRVLNFKSKLEDLGVLYWEYVDNLEFERRVREHLVRQVLQLAKPTYETKPEDQAMLGKL